MRELARRARGRSRDGIDRNARGRGRRGDRRRGTRRALREVPLLELLLDELVVDALRLGLRDGRDGLRAVLQWRAALAVPEVDDELPGPDLAEIDRVDLVASPLGEDEC